MRNCLLCLVVGLCAGCATSIVTANSGESEGRNAQPTIEFLGFPDCPNTPVLRDNLTHALASMGRGWTFTDTNQEPLPDGDIRRGYPTPTVLVNGRDLYGLPVPSTTSLGCRIYAGGVPGATDLAEKLRATARN